MGIIIGIDLGTTTSAVCVLENGRPEVIPSRDQGKRIIDSIVSVNDINESYIVGSRAKREVNKSKVAKEVKRDMGTTNLFQLGKNTLSPEEVSAEILKELKSYAEDYLGEEVTEAIITVPAMFESPQKSATIEAGRLAGLKVERLINEPTAAALAYGFENMRKEEKILVYDFGGGTFDVTILDFDEGILDVLGTDGDSYLGGKNIDKILLKYLAHETGVDIKSEDKELKLTYACEEAKKELSYSTEAHIIVPEYNIDFVITRSKLEELIGDRVNYSIGLLHKAMSKAKLDMDEIDVVLPVGGTTRIPLIQQKLKEIFGNKVKKFKDPQEVVAMGAAIQGGIKSDEISSENGIIITDVCSLSLGISCIGEHQGMLMPNIYSPIIYNNTSLPCEKSEIYYTASDDQEHVNIEVYQGEHPMVMENIKIGEFASPSIPKGKAGEESIKVTFAYDINSILNVEVEILSTGEKTVVPYTMASAEEKEKNVTSYKNSSFYDEYKSIMDMAEDKMKKVSSVNKQKIKSLFNDLKAALLSEDKSKLESIDDALTDLLFEV